MNIKELQQELLIGFGDKLSIFGFGNKAKDQSFFRPIADGWVSVHLSFINHSEDFDVTMDVAIRFNQVENLVNSTNKLLTKKEKEFTATLGVEIGNLSIGAQRRWSVTSKDEIPSVIDSIFNAFEKYGEPYLEKYSSMDKAYELLSGDEKKVWMHSPFHATRAKKIIAIAHLLDHIDIQNQISSLKRTLEDKKDFGLSDFLSFSNSLQMHSRK